MTHITLAMAPAEPEDDRLFGPSYHARQAALAEQAASKIVEEHRLVQMPVKRAERHGATFKIDPAEWQLVGRETMASIGTVKACRYGMIEVQWGCTRWWVESQYVEVLE